jgi:hypothetical protein
MNIGGLFVLIEALKAVDTARPGVEGQTYEIKPNCGPGLYAYKDPFTGKYSCVRIPTGR